MVNTFSIVADARANVEANDVQAFSYDAVDDRGRRRPAPTKVRTEDYHATAKKRETLSASTQDLARNFELAAWAIRKHLDYVTSFSFQAKTKDRVFNAQLENLVDKLSSKERFDVAGRHPLRRAVRLTEACRAKDGDHLWLKIKRGKNRGRVQPVEAYRIATPADLPRQENLAAWVNGVRVNKQGRHEAYGICDVERRGHAVLKRITSARNCFYHGFFDRWDQVRGISPLAAALNRFRDTYEGFEYAHAKLKISQLFGLEFYRSSDGEGVFGSAATSATTDANGDGTNDGGYEVNLTGGGPFVLDMDADDRVNILESKTPATETVNFLKLAIHLAIKSLDIPYSFLDESATNFYGSRGGLIQYLLSCKNKRADVSELLDSWTRWRLGIAVVDGELDLPPGVVFDDLAWEWVPAGVPWWDPVKEARGAAMSVAMGVSSPQRECRLVGTDFERNILETAEAIEFAKQNNVDLKFADSSAFGPEITTEGNVD